MTNLYDFGQSDKLAFPVFRNRIGNILPKTTESGATFSQFRGKQRKSGNPRNLLRGQVTIKVVANTFAFSRICLEICILDDVFSRI